MKDPKHPHFIMILFAVLILFLAFDPLLSAQSVIFSDDFETGDLGWQTIAAPGTGAIQNLWRLQTDPQTVAIRSDVLGYVELPDEPNATLPQAFSGNHVWWYGDPATGTFLGDFDPALQVSDGGGTSSGPNAGALVSPAIDLSNVTEAILKFETWWEIEGVDSNQFDTMGVFAVSDSQYQSFLGGQITIDQLTLVPLGRATGLINPVEDVNTAPFQPYTTGGVGQPGQYVGVTIDLAHSAIAKGAGADVVGSVERIVFVFATVDVNYNAFRGWIIDNVTVLAQSAAAPQIDSVAPDIGNPTDDPNTVDVVEQYVLLLQGQNFVAGAQASAVPADQPTATPVLMDTSVLNDNQAQVIVPATLSPNPGIFNLTLTNPDGQSVSRPSAFSITTTLPPSLLDISPKAAYNSQPTTVTISGSNFEVGIDVVLFNGILGDFTLTTTNVTATEITAEVPSGLPPGGYNLIVRNPDGQQDSLTQAFTVLSSTAVIVSSVTPSKGSIFAPTNLRIAGLNFQPGATVKLGDVELDVTSVADTEITATVPDRFAPGTYDVTVINPDSSSGTLASGFSILAASGNTSLILRSGADVKAFQMMVFNAIPVLPASSLILDVLEEDLGQQRPEDWRFFLFNGTDYDEVARSLPGGENEAAALTDSAAAVQFGKGAWIISRNGGVLTLSGDLYPEELDFVLQLDPGFNMIGTPYSQTSVPVSRLLVSTGEGSAGIPLASPGNTLTAGTVFAFDPTAPDFYVPAVSMDPSVGYWLENLTGAPVFLFMPSPLSGPPLKAVSVQAQYDGERHDRLPPPPPLALSYGETGLSDNLTPATPFSCAIATAAHGLPFSDCLDALRRLRDFTFERNRVGENLLRAYYRLSSKIQAHTD